MPTQNQPNSHPTRSASIFFTTRASYLRWYWSALVIVILIAAGLVAKSASIYNQTLNLINESNAKMIEKSGIEIITELNKNSLDQAKQIVEKKNSPLELPPRARNIFLFNSYVEFSQAPVDELLPVTN